MPRAPRSYHHGDLRRALLTAALHIVRIEGTAGLTLRAVARRAGVSHQAPYHHFSDRAALVAAVAQEGFDRLADELARAQAAAENPVARMQESGVAYVVFAVRHPEHFRVMFGPELADRSSHPELARAAGQVFEALLAPAALVLAAQPSGGGGVGATLWSAVHGLAMLLIDGQLPVRGGAGRPGAAADAAAARRLALEVTERLWLGLQPLVAPSGRGASSPGTS